MPEEIIETTLTIAGEAILEWISQKKIIFIAILIILILFILVYIYLK